jgi:phospholipase C
MGIRIPAVAVSPYVRRGYVSHSVFGFESILKMIEYRFGLAPLTKRDAYAQNIARSFDWGTKPRLTPPELPDAPMAVSQQCPNQAPGLFKTGSGPVRPHEHDMTYLLKSGYLDRLGFDYKPATPESTYRQPHTVMSRYHGR